MHKKQRRFALIGAVLLVAVVALVVIASRSNLFKGSLAPAYRVPSLTPPTQPTTPTITYQPATGATQPTSPAVTQPTSSWLGALPEPTTSWVQKVQSQLLTRSPGDTNVLIGKWLIAAEEQQVEIRKFCFDLDAENQITNETDAFTGSITLKTDDNTVIFLGNTRNRTFNVDGVCNSVALPASKYITLTPGQDKYIYAIVNLSPSIQTESLLKAKFDVTQWRNIATNTIITKSTNTGVEGGALTVNHIEKRCAMLENWINDGTYSSSADRAELTALINECVNSTVLWYGGPTLSKCNRIANWYYEGTLASEHPNALIGAEVCKRIYPADWAIIPTDRCAQIRSWIREGTLTTQHSDAFSQIQLCRDRCDFLSDW